MTQKLMKSGPMKKEWMMKTFKDKLTEGMTEETFELARMTSGAGLVLLAPTSLTKIGYWVAVAGWFGMDLCSERSWVRGWFSGEIEEYDE